MTFTIKTTRPMMDILTDVSRLLSETGGHFMGNAEAGQFTGKTPIGELDGSYRVSGEDLTITITKKPFFVGANTIERKLREYFR